MPRRTTNSRLAYPGQHDPRRNPERRASFTEYRSWGELAQRRMFGEVEDCRLPNWCARLTLQRPHAENDKERFALIKEVISSTAGGPSAATTATFDLLNFPRMNIEELQLETDWYAMPKPRQPFTRQNRIKEKQLDLFADRTSTQTIGANQIWLYFSSFAYVLLCTLRRLGLQKTELKRAQYGTIRLKLLKIGAQVRFSVRNV